LGQLGLTADQQGGGDGDGGGGGGRKQKRKSKAGAAALPVDAEQWNRLLREKEEEAMLTTLLHHRWVGGWVGG
jgi:hypothetical protein